MMQRVEFEVVRVFGTGESATGPIITPNFVNRTVVGASGLMLGMDLDFEANEVNEVAEEIVPIAPTGGGGYIPIMPLSITSWDDLRADIMLGGTQTIEISANFSTAGAVNPAAIQLPAGADITLTSAAGGPFTITQTHDAGATASTQRHFIVPANTTLRLNNITLSGNADALAHRHGGITVNGANARLYLNAGTTITNNRRNGADVSVANGGGGGALASSGGHIIMNAGVTISNNFANDGGGVAAHSGSTFTMNGGYILNNWANRMGGGAHTHNLSTSNLISGRIAYNDAQQGGGIGANGESATFNILGNGLIEENIGRGAGGGMSIATGAFPPAALNMSNGTVRNNTSSVGGGLRAVSSINITITGGSIYGNTATNNGGGIFFDPSTDPAHALTTHLAITGGYIFDNHAGGDGGGIYTVRAIPNNPLDYNTPGGVYDFMTIGSGATFHSNTARQWFYPPTVINAPGGTPTNQLPNIEWNIATGSSVNSNGYLYLLNNYDINFVGQTGFWYLGNQEKFRFTKTNSITNPHQGLGLLGAWFQLYWRPDSAAAWQTRGPLVSSNTQGIVRLPLTQTTGEYRLIETLAPSGFQTPFGYWLIDTSRVNTRLAVNGISEHSGNPQFVRHPATTGNWYVGNRADFELPLAGGLGSMVQDYTLHTIAGLLALSAGTAGAVIIHTRKKKAKQLANSPHDN